MAGKTQYEVEILYRAVGMGKAIDQTKQAGAASDKLAKSLEWVKRAAIGIGAAFVFGKIKSALIDSNRELQSMQISMSAVLGMSLDMPFRKAEPVAARLVEHYRNIAKVSPGTAADFIEFNNFAMGAVMNAGGSLGQLKKITEGGVIAGKSFGFRGDVAGRDVQQALTGNVTMQTPMIKMLLGSEKKIAEFNKMSGQDRVKSLVKAFESPALKDAAKRFGASYEGELSTLKDNASNVMRIVGKPLFDQLTKWLHQINEWASRNSGKIAAFAKSVGEGLASGARWLVKGVSYLVEHRGVILAIAAAFGALKMANMGAGQGGIINGLVSSLGMFGLAIGAATLALWALSKIPGGKTGGGEDVVRRHNRGLTGAQMGIREKLTGSAFSEGGYAVDRDQFRNAMAAQRGNAEAVRAGQAISAKVASNHAKFQAQIDGMVGKYRTKDDDLKKKIEPNRQKVNVVIKRVEVVADDADRFIAKIVGAIGKEIRSPSQWDEMPRGAT